jgi:hypothetical protein
MRLLSVWPAFLCITLSAGTATGMAPRTTTATVATRAAAMTGTGCPAEAAAKQAAEGLLALGCAVAEWLNGAVNYFGDLAAPKNQRSTAKGLRHFADDLAAIERDKRSLIATLRRGGDLADVDVDLKDLTQSVGQAQQTLGDRLMPLLNAQYKKGGDTLNLMLEKAAGGKADWLREARQQLPRMTDRERAAFLVQGDSAVAALHRAQIAARMLADKIAPDAQ